MLWPVFVCALLACKSAEREAPPPVAVPTLVPPQPGPPAAPTVAPKPTAAPVERSEPAAPDDTAGRRKWKVGPGDWGWSNRCYELAKAGFYKDGAKVCHLGLKYAQTDAIRGALYYNHGYISESQGHWASARLFYGKSLKVRPGNATTRRALARVRAK